MGVLLGNGWYRGRPGLGAGSATSTATGSRCSCRSRSSYKDGREEIIGTDQNWKATTGPILMSEIYHGETYDARLEKPGWAAPGFDDRQWAGVKVANHRKDILIAPAGPPVRRIEEVRPVKDLQNAGGRDGGRHGAEHGRLGEAKVAGAGGDDRHAAARRSARQGGQLLHRESAQRQSDGAVHAQGRRAEIYEPHFTFMGFRYVAVDGYPGELTPDSLTGIVIHSDMPPTGEFETSEPAHQPAAAQHRLGQKGNFVDVPTDCPQRDERLGWTGDAQVFARTAAFNMDVAGFFTKWLKDVAADQNRTAACPTSSRTC